MRIVVPSWKSGTVGILALHTFFLVMRTYLTVVVARIDGRLVKDLVNGNGKSFMKTLGVFMAMALPATYTNSMIRYLQSKLALSLRTKLTDHVHKLYMSENTYYKAINLDNRIDGADQLITTDVNRFCTAFANLYSNLGKPVLDLIIFNYQLSRTIGLAGMWGLALNYVVTASILRAATPPFGKLAAQEAKLEGDFRTAHSRLITNAEEIGFYNGEELEKSFLNRTYSKLVKHINSIYRIRIAYNMFEDFVLKYSWSAVGLLMASIPVFFPDAAGARTKREEALLETQPIELIDGVDLPPLDGKTGSRTQNFITNKRLMVSLADAGGRIIYSYKELSELAGYTYRVYNMLRVLDDLKHNRFLQADTVTNPVYTLDNIHGVVKINNECRTF
jgi:ATP-binding cassette subfamily D (ALD) long-chain fatty acid import protein